jgi:hypothetical protein
MTVSPRRATGGDDRQGNRHDARFGGTVGPIGLRLTFRAGMR